jgi:hypothetical protein
VFVDCIVVKLLCDEFVEAADVVFNPKEKIITIPIMNRNILNPFPKFLLIFMSFFTSFFYYYK